MLINQWPGDRERRSSGMVYWRAFSLPVLLLAAIVGLAAPLRAQEGGAAPLERILSQGPAPAITGIAAPPVVNIWYSSPQPFGKIGTPQRWVNILGNATDPDEIRALWYRLNGGPIIWLNIGPDTRRLVRPGDFNVDISYADLVTGNNTVEITAEDNSPSREKTIVTVTVRKFTGSTWPIPYTVAWSSSATLFDSAQVVDGKWSVTSGGVRTLEPGYDRIIAIGDTAWNDYEATTEMTVHALDPAAFLPPNVGPAVGFLFRWKGHTDQPQFNPPDQPKEGYLPLGAIGWYHWQQQLNQGKEDQWELLGNGVNNVEVKDFDTRPEIAPELGVPYHVKMRVRTVPSIGGQYKMKAWRVGMPEPPWFLVGQEEVTDPSHGSMTLLAHQCDVTFGATSVKSIPSDVVDPIIQNPGPQVIARGSEAVVNWQTDEPATSAVVYGFTKWYDHSVSDSRLVTGHSMLLTGLEPSTTYHFQVYSSDASGNVGGYFDLTFTTGALSVPSAPQPIAPAGGARGITNPVTIQWNRSIDATSYRLQVATNATFASGIVLDDPAVPDTSRLVTGLAGGVRHYWRVRAQNDAGNSSYSTPSDFVTALTSPVLASPADSAVGLPVTTTLRWRKSGDATLYTVQVATSPTFTSGIIVDDSSVSDTLYVVNDMQYHTLYHWRVRARTTEEVSGYSPAWHFTTTVGATVLLSPPDGATAQPTSDLALLWGKVKDASRYRLQLGTDPTFVTGLVKDDSTITDTVRVINGLVTYTAYYWRISVRNAAGWGPFTDRSMFMTFLPLPGAVSLVSPIDNAPIAADTVKLVWRQAQPNVSRYRLDISPDSTFLFASVDSSLTDTSSVHRQMELGKTYFWRVFAYNAAGWGPPSPLRAFVRLTTDADDAPSLPVAFSLDQNYPNPFNPETRIGFAVPVESHVRLDVYTPLGELVSTLVNERLPAGWHAVQFRPEHLSSGVYIYRVSANGVSLTRKMVLLR